MQLSSTSFHDQQAVPTRLAFCKPSAVGHVALSDNRNPHLAWSGAPAGTQSFALICHDPDVPSRADDVNREGHTVAADLPRVDFFHWVLVDIPASWHEIAEGAMSANVTPRGKGPLPAGGPRHGINDYTAWFKGDQDMEGLYHGYDGPCPPRNDERLHHYTFTLYALSIARCPVDGAFTGQQVRQAIGGHVLAQASLTGTYTLNPTLLNMVKA
ncbi:MAG: phospholipid-binding protein [Thiomonas sp. 13-66-29]|jgi:Raf kinase inhibitor-like YbhB/YbcL family protein|nr:MAG: phospholipid-binding protein [Thiomonas sp. 13-66-29]